MQDKSLYVPLTSLWEVFTDKDAFDPNAPSGSFFSYFLRDGYAYFYKDTQRTTAKPVYIVTGSPPNYNYIEYGQLVLTGIGTSAWKVPLNEQGAFDKIIYGYPYDEDGEAELYYVEFYNANGVPQSEKSREGIPSLNGGGTPSTSSSGLINYVPNGEFLIHNNLQADDDHEAGEIRQPTTIIAPGNWTFERPTDSSAKDILTFERFGSFTTTPLGSPRYSLKVECQQAYPGDGFKYIVLKFNDVNKFASDTDKYTFTFWGQTYTGSSVNVKLVLIKNFGTNGSGEQTPNVLQQFTLTNTWTQFTKSFVFGSNSGFSIGNLNDDYTKLAFALPVDTIFSLGIDRVGMVAGDYSSLALPIETNKQFIYRSILSDYVPDPDGGDIGLPLILSKNGLVPDYSNIGNIYTSAKQAPELGELMSDGSYYDPSLYSDDGIPYSRLQKKIYYEDAENNMSYPVYGTGIDNFIFQPFSNDLTKAISLNNDRGTVSQVVDGTTPTGFTFQRISAGQALNTFVSYFSNQTGCVYINSLFKFHVPNSFSAGTTGFTFNEQYKKTNTYPDSVEKDTTNYLVKLFATFPSGNITNLEGKYFDIWDASNQNRVWFTVDGTGTRPTIPVSANEIKINLFSSFSLIDLLQAISFGCSSLESTLISFTAGSSITPGSYFRLFTVSKNFHIYYVKGGVGADPNIANSIGIAVNMSDEDNAQTIAFKTIQAVNSKYYAVPDLRGQFIKIYNNADAAIDLSQIERYAANYVKNGLLLGSKQFSGNRNHNHEIFFQSPNSLQSGADFGRYSITTAGSSAPSTVASGQIDSRPNNIYLNAFIKY